jgi:iron complex outermembrane receptor protein
VLAALRLSHSWQLGDGTLSLLARVDNLSDVAYAGAVIVNEVNGRYFETAAGRTMLLAARWRMPF